jgi:hypothetical protein
VSTAIKGDKNALPTYMLRHHIQALQNTIEHYVYYAEVLRQRARTEASPMNDATLRESANYGECVDRLRCAIACLLDLDPPAVSPDLAVDPALAGILAGKGDVS